MPLGSGQEVEWRFPASTSGWCYPLPWTWDVPTVGKQSDERDSVLGGDARVKMQEVSRSLGLPVGWVSTLINGASDLL